MWVVNERQLNGGFFVPITGQLNWICGMLGRPIQRQIGHKSMRIEYHGTRLKRHSWVCFSSFLFEPKISISLKKIMYLFFFSGRGLVVSLGFEGRANADWPTKDGRGVEEDGRPVELDHKFPPQQHFWKCAPSHFFFYLNNNNRRRNTCINAVYIYMYTRRCERQSKVSGNKYRTQGGHGGVEERAAPLIVKPTSFLLFTQRRRRKKDDISYLISSIDWNRTWLN